jgi:hypothetical protein
VKDPLIKALLASALDRLNMLADPTPMLCSEKNFRVVAHAAAGSTESGRTPAFFYAQFGEESHIVDVNTAV